MTSVSDGLVPWVGKAGQVRVGHLLQGYKKTKSDLWKVLEFKNPPQITYAYTLWMRAVNLANGEMVSIPPRSIMTPQTFMVTPEQLVLCERSKRPPEADPSWPVDSEEVLLLVAELGAQEIATRDETTGEIICPAYASGGHATDRWRYGVEELEHLKICHGLDISGLEALPPAEALLERVRIHGQLHSPDADKIQHRGFPHRHVPEDHSTL